MPAEEVVRAFRFMREELGISHERVKPVLRKLLKLYDNNWALIEGENYRTLADAIFENEMNEDEEKNELDIDSRGPPAKKPHLERQNDKNSSNKGKKPMSSDLPVGERNQSSSKVNTTTNKPSLNPQNVGSSQKVNMSIKKETNSIGTSNSHDLVVYQPSTQIKRKPRRINDITKGREKMKISLIDESGCETQPKFTYIHQNTVYQDAYIRFSLARIADDNCCVKCSGNCISGGVPCECARETGGEFAYTSQGVLREEFLNDCISMNIEPQKHHYVYCNNCPLERAKDENRPEPCKGHLVRKFIKECWNKCGCDMDCGNRVVQRGISRKLQVFSTNESKGWGLRTLENLPKGAFVCEYVGEILTNTELYWRNMKIQHNGRHTYPVYLDADWSSEKVLKDEEALCLDATKFGNVARFINHRCYDANLIEIPVEVETPDHHYYHIAFFTKREVKASEELTWNEDEEKNELDIDSRGPPAKKPHLERQNDKNSSNKGKKPMSSDLPVGERNQSSSKVNTTTNKPSLNPQNVGSSQKVNMSIKKETNSIGTSNSHDLVVYQPSTQIKRKPRRINDITKGREKMKISLIDESGCETQPKFTYIHQNTVYQDAYIRFSLARIADDNCCVKCSGNCISGGVPCECARETGGEFAYTSQGVLREEFLNDCISMNIEPQKHHYVYCNNCPLERAKDENRPEPCKGHLVRKFIKECWNKCGCDMDCGNRVVQRGISRKLQVFSTNESKGWGLRTLENLPKGAFVCEYVGEILTNTELYWRNMKIQHNGRHTYPVYLDADWSSEKVLKDEEALCLDATKFGNVARFINHRCYDANLIEIPVEVETPDHHYYHIAFFTKREVKASEELTWDYKIDFTDKDHPIEAFRCCCGYKYCRDPKSKEPIHVHSDD